MNCFIILISDVFHFLMCRDFCCHFEIDISVVNKKIRIAADFMIDRWNCLLNIFNQLLNFTLLNIICFQLVFVYWESSCKDLLICNCQMYKLNWLNFLLNSWLRVFYHSWLRVHLSWISYKMRIEIDIWFNEFLNLNFTILNYLSKICSHCHWLELFLSWFSVCWDVKLDFMSEHCQKSTLAQRFVKNHENSLILIDKLMKSMIKKINLMKRIIFLHKVDDFAYFLMKIDRNLMILWYCDS